MGSRTGAHWWPAGQRGAGQMLVVGALVLVGLVMMVALTVDVGNAYAQRRMAQNAADAAALAGARALALGEDPEGPAEEYAVTRNGASGFACGVAGSHVVVTVTRVFPTFFAPVFGLTEMTVTTVADAAHEAPGGWMGDLMPMTVHLDAVVRNQSLYIWDDDKVPSQPGNGVVADGQRGWLNFNGGNVSNSEIVGWVTNGYDGEITLPQWINGSPGTRTSALHAMQDTRLHTVVYVPIYDTTRSPGQAGNGKYDYRIVTVGAFYVEQVVDRGNPKYVMGRFIDYVASQYGGGTIDVGLRVVSLKR
ncbi:MAG: pilus assembly protein TadG-related protein [Anaerolineae bacterium]